MLSTVLAVALAVGPRPPSASRVVDLVFNEDVSAATETAMIDEAARIRAPYLRRPTAALTHQHLQASTALAVSD